MLLFYNSQVDKSDVCTVQSMCILRDASITFSLVMQKYL